MARILYRVPTVHSRAECRVSRRFTEEDFKKLPYGEELEKKLDEVWNSIEKFWDGVDAVFEELQLPWDRVLIFCESDFPRPTELSKYLHMLRYNARKGRRTAQLVLRLVERGARLERTESRMVWKLYGFFKRSALPLWGIPGRMEHLFFLLRDRYIAHRINHALKDEKIGLLFLGAAHGEFQKHLDSDIIVQNICVDLVQETMKYGNE